MRVLIRAHLNVDASNLSIREGTLGPLLQKVFAVARPEATYFCVDSGRRTVLAIADISPEMIPQIAEPMFHDLSADLAFIPVMTGQELEAGLETWAKQG